jgi:uncharacterized damage-inducible protein DinB
MRLPPVPAARELLMNQADFALLFRYNQWAWDRVLDRVARLTPEQYTALAPVPHGSLHGTLVHALAADVNWRNRIEGNSPTKLLNEADLPDFQTLLPRWENESKRLVDLVGRQSDAQLQGTLNYKTTKGAPMSEVLWHVLAHVVNHGTQHRSEAAMLLTTFNESPGDIDLIVFLRETG